MHVADRSLLSTSSERQVALCMNHPVQASSPPLPGQSRSANEVGLDRVQLALVVLLWFSVAASNGRPAILSSGYLCGLLTFLLFFYSLLSSRNTLSIPKSSTLSCFAWATWCLVATSSALVNQSEDATVNLLFAYFVPSFMYVTLVTLRWSLKDLMWATVALAGGVSLRFGWGAYVYWQEWGWQSVGEMMSNRFDIERMSGYMLATLGNTGNSASMLAICFAMLLWSTRFFPQLDSFKRGVIATGLIVAFWSVLLTASRSAVFFVAGNTIVWMMTIRNSFLRFALIVMTLVTVAWTFGEFDANVLDALTRAGTVDASDNSVGERLASMEAGLSLILDYPMGVGPGMSYTIHPNDVAHQFLIAQMNDIGVLACFPVTFLALSVMVRTGRVFRRLFFRNTGDSRELDRLPFVLGSFTWFAWAMTTNIPLSSGSILPWAGSLALLLAASDCRLIEARQQASDGVP